MSIISTFENQCRALTSAASPDENASRFLVGTLTPNRENLIYLFEYKDDNNNLAKISFKFPFGESWHLSTSSKYPDLFTGVVEHDKQLKVSLFKLPKEVENTIEDDYGLSESQIENVFDIAVNDNNLTRQCHWHPDSGEQLLICNNASLEFYDINTQQEVQKFSLLQALENQFNFKENLMFPQVTDLRWSSLFNCSVVAATIGSKIYGIDTRIPNSSPSSICWLIEDKRCNKIRSTDFNPNSQYYLASGGDDCRANFWDLRCASSPTLHLQCHSHWIWSIRYNPFHDQLVLSAGSDARVALMRVQSIASEPFGQMVDYEEEASEDQDENRMNNDGGDEKDQADGVDSKCEDTDKSNVTKESRQLKDEVINVYEEHDDSVYAAEWATDAWIFASLGFESRLVINEVPKKEKFSILF